MYVREVQGKILMLVVQFDDVLYAGSTGLASEF